MASTVGRVSRVARPRGPLPRRVYWVRRLLVLVLVPALLVGSVVGIAHLLGSRTGTDAAVRVGSGAARDTGTAEPTPTSAGAKPSPTLSATSGPTTKSPRGLPQPDGPCRPDDVLVTPRLPDPHAGAPVSVVLLLTTLESDACTFDVDSQSVFLTVSAEDGPMWSSQQCPTAIPTTTVVPRRERAARVLVTWHGRESDPTCSEYSPWVLAGEYVASAVARGSVSPIDVGFVLLPAERPTVTITPTPTATPTEGSDTGRGRDGERRR